MCLSIKKALTLSRKVLPKGRIMEENITGGIPTPNVEQQGETITPTQPTTPTNTEQTKVAPVEKTFTQDEVNKIVSGRVNGLSEKAINELLKEFGLESKEQLKSAVDNSKKVSNYEKTIGEQNTKLKEYEFVDVCNENKVKADCIDKVKTYLKGAGLEPTSENVAKVLSENKEWVREPFKSAVQPLNVGSNPSPQSNGKSDFEKGRDYFPSLRNEK